MHYIVYDLEATCWREPGHTKKSEIIEIGAVKVDDNGEILGEFAEFVKPTKYPRISRFCTQLTSITQKDVDPADTYPLSIQRFQEWIGVGEQDYLLCSWGFFDRDQLLYESKKHGLPTEWIHRHISVKHQYAEFGKIPTLTGMKKALKAEEIELVGKHHRGIDDARNIAKLFVRYLGDWKYPA